MITSVGSPLVQYLKEKSIKSMKLKQVLSRWAYFIGNREKKIIPQNLLSHLSGRSIDPLRDPIILL